jgi:hypothetical protein
MMIWGILRQSPRYAIERLSDCRQVPARFQGRVPSPALI